MVANPIRALELHYLVIQFLLILVIQSKLDVRPENVNTHILNASINFLQNMRGQVARKLVTL